MYFQRSVRIGLASGFLLLAACAPLLPEPSPEEAPGEKPSEEVLTTESEPTKMTSQPLKYLAGRQLKPQPTRPLNVRSRCQHRDAVGTATQLDLWVKNAEVKNFNATVTMKSYGTCRFQLKDFTQIQTLPQAVLQAKDGSGCLVRLWEEDKGRQGSRVTVAFNQCPQACERDAFSYLWPILVEAKTGRCF